MKQLPLLSLRLPGTNGSSVEINPPGTVPGGTGMTQLVLRTGIILLLVTLTIVVLFYIIWGGVQWIISEGDKTKVQAARNKIIYAIIGLIVAFMSFFIISVVGNIFGVQFFG
jgi:hypothetical protein